VSVVLLDWHYDDKEIRQLQGYQAHAHPKPPPPLGYQYKGQSDSLQ
jgi:hypothetical protein